MKGKKRRTNSIFEQGLCVVCGIRVQTASGICKSGKNKGKRIYSCFCRSCKSSGKKRWPHIEYKKKICEQCGFVAVHPCQLDVDHIDGNNENNDVSNLRTLCANCHRLKTYLNKDWD